MQIKEIFNLLDWIGKIDIQETGKLVFYQARLTWPGGYTCPKIAMNVAQKKYINFLKHSEIFVSVRDFCLTQLHSVNFVDGVWCWYIKRLGIPRCWE